MTPASRCRSVIRFRTCAWIETSSADTGSSATTSLGRVMSARAIAMRWRWPPENSWGYLRRVGGASRPRPSDGSTRARRSARRRAAQSRRAVRRRCLAPAGADRASRKDPGRSSACARASCAIATRESRSAIVREGAPRPKSASPARSRCAPASTCPSPIRQQCRTSALAHTEADAARRPRIRCARTGARAAGG